MLACLLAYSMVQDILWKADSYLACHTIACFLYGIRRFITVLIKAYHWTLSWVSRIQFTPSIPVSLRSILFLSSFQLSLPFGPPNQNFVNTSPLPHACHMSLPLHPPWFSHPNNIRWRRQAMKYIVQFSPRSVFPPFRSKYPPQLYVFKNPQSVFLPQSERPSFAPM